MRKWPYCLISTGSCSHRDSTRYSIYNSDYTLGEITSQLNISRQNIDGVKKGKNTLKEFEDKLGHVKRFLKHEQALKKILSDLRRVKCAGKVRDGEIIDSCIEELEKVINDL